jgi:hypothetical protein
LATATKGNQSATNYLIFIKRLTDELAIVGQSITYDDIITCILVALGHEYEQFYADNNIYFESFMLVSFLSSMLIIIFYVDDNNLLLFTEACIQVCSLARSSLYFATK